MIEPILFYIGTVTLLLFFWLYGVVAFVRDVKTELVPWARRRRGPGEQRDEPADG